MATWKRDEQKRTLYHWQGDGFTITLESRARFWIASIREGDTRAEMSDTLAYSALRSLRETVRCGSAVLSDAAWEAMWEAMVAAAKVFP